MRLSGSGHRHARACVCVLISFLFFRWKHCRIYASLMCMNVSVFVEHAQQHSCQHTRAHTCRDHLHTLELRWWRVWRWFAYSSRSSYNHAHKHTYCVCVYTYFFFVCLLVWVYTTDCVLTLCLCFYSIQATRFEQQPVVGPATRCFRRAFIAWVSVCVSRGCLESTVLYKHQDTRTYMYRQTDRLSGFIS